ncbi:hypothetical protein JYT85_02760 [Desulfocapsa sp. AH-315-G09]|nr:hypothetical protein [Desulfocapsa sp. AH-315-G09]
MKSKLLISLLFLCLFNVDVALGQISIMPVGDSITFGTWDSESRPSEVITGYRQPLYLMLQQAGFDIDFVGGMNSGKDAYPLFDSEHEGHSGWRDDEIASNIYNFLVDTPADVILLHIGSNALNEQPSDVENILDEIDKYESDFGREIIVFVARILNQSTYDLTATSFNDNVEAMIQGRTSSSVNPDKIIMVDMEDGANVDYRLEPLGDMKDNLHPNTRGFEKMAHQWFSNLSNFFSPDSPVAHAGYDITHSEGTIVYLDGSESTDPNGDTLIYNWEQVGGEIVTILDGDTPMPSFVSPTSLNKDELLTFKLIVADSQSNTSSDTVEVAVKATSPIYDNIALGATVLASSENLGSSQLAIKAIDGVIDGFPGDSSREWATEEGAGAWLELKWSSAYLVDRIIIYDRPNSYDYITDATIFFNDGSTLPIGSLYNSGYGRELVFPQKSITSLTFMVESTANTPTNIGLAEIEVFGMPDPTANHSPVASAGKDQIVLEGDLVSLDGTASSDIDGDILTYEWQQTAGVAVTLQEGDTATATFTTPSGLTQDEVLNFELTVSDGQFYSQASVVVLVQPDSPFYNIAFEASISASSEYAQADQLASKAIDGVIDGYPGDSSREWSTEGEGAGAWLELTWPTTYVINRIILYDRPNAYDHIISATISFNDGSILSIDSLANDGNGIEYVFPQKSITNLILTVESTANTPTNIGLAEIEVFGMPDPTANHSPVASAGEDQIVLEGELVSLDGTASSDIDGDILTYEWQQTAGVAVTLQEGDTATATFTTPSGLTQDEVLNFELTVSDGQFYSQASVVVLVQPDSPFYNIAFEASISASSEYAQADQLASKAIDGVIDGYPGDSSREWSTEGEGVGAWLELNWPGIYLINRIILYDRPNAHDHITSATITFNDETTLSIGLLGNDGSGVEYVFAQKSISNLILTVEGTANTPTNIGLAEIEVFGVPQ